MRVSIVAVGRLRGRAEQELFDEYRKRALAQGRSLGISSIDLRELPESSAQTVTLRKADEAQRILSALPSRATLIALDEGGEQVSSVELSGRVRAWLDGGVNDLGFAIGGPDGHGEEVLSKASLRVAFGRMTWPHGLTRVMLAEQIYRSVTILLNHPYHRA
ncbi:23S rRNA (pseudouridine1915-N3)-methyltransferase [Rhodoligotrophos appendicifer]|uniref:23S rRNA (pseudouridine(1915)-N(3))-methyltransferase RlmH n=1 Tax=Rhodoligotrophos appendicifer TaxID=987056 RepID=UPI00117F2951|nr:23S rRNA (pseudouridine(1915)-N(3))-methyltransferase RlmH [Rhodoligotrophos appendicifer]